MEGLGVTRGTTPAFDVSNDGCNDNPESAPEKSRVDKQEIDTDVALARAKYSSEHEVLIESVRDPKHCQDQDATPVRGTPTKGEGDCNEERDWDWLNHFRILNRGELASKRYCLPCHRKCASPWMDQSLPSFRCSQDPGSWCYVLVPLDA
jgi:hypothetical protein